MASGVVSSEIYDEQVLVLRWLVVSYFLVEMCITPLPVVCVFYSFFILPECFLMLMALTPEANV